jgi:hypothetical protein
MFWRVGCRHFQHFSSGKSQQRYSPSFPDWPDSKSALCAASIGRLLFGEEGEEENSVDSRKINLWKKRFKSVAIYYFVFCLLFIF